MLMDTGARSRKQTRREGFALPSVVVVSLIMISVVTSVTYFMSVTRQALVTQEYEQMAKAASDAGLAMAQACLKQSNYVAEWTNEQPLRPNTDCRGAVVSTKSAYVMERDLTRTAFTVPKPAESNGMQRITVTGRVSLVRASNGAEWRSYENQNVAMYGASLSFNNVTFGYANTNGAFFSVIDSRGAVRSVGYNGYGQFGSGNRTSQATPQIFRLPSGDRATSIYTSFLSHGRHMLVVTAGGNAYGAGRNTSGQLGDGSSSDYQTIPTRFGLPSGVNAEFAAVGQETTFVIGSNGNVYAAGSCDDDRLGTGSLTCPLGRQSRPVRVALPAVNANNPNTQVVRQSDWLQATNLTTDRYTGFVRMEGGAVYGWGDNSTGQLGQGDKTNRSTPVSVGLYGNSGQPKAKQIAFDGVALYILDDAGEVYAVGQNQHGELAGAGAPIRTYDTANGNFCMDNPGNGTSRGRQVQIYSCNDRTSQAFEWRADGSLRVQPNSTTELCVDLTSGGTANGTVVQLWTCNGSAAQKWEMLDNGTIRNPGSGRCLRKNGGSANGTTLVLWDCGYYTDRVWSLDDSVWPRKVPMPDGEKVTRVTTDQNSALFLTASGKVWGSGINDWGQLGQQVTSSSASASKNINPALQQFQLPTGRFAVDVYTTKVGAGGSGSANTYIVADNGDVYGAGNNQYGQLGVNSTTSNPVAVPQRMQLPSDVRARSVQSGLGTTVILTTDGKIYTVGNNAHGQLGDGTTTNRSLPRANQYTNIIKPLVY